MAIRLPRLLLLPLLAASAGGAVAQDGDITIYRCTDASGRLAVQDSPCASGQQQQTRRMIQPADPPPRAEPVAPAVPEPAPEPPPPPPVVASHTPKPMYECIRDDGTRYTSDDGEGNPRWVANGWGWWQPTGSRRGHRGTIRGGGGSGASGTTAPPPSSGGSSSGGNGAPQLRFRDVGSTPPPPPPPPGHGHGHRDHGYGYGGGAWVRDECHALPQAETCSLLRDRREEIRHRRFNAQANERATLNVEERGINARLSEDCGGA